MGNIDNPNPNPKLPENEDRYWRINGSSMMLSDWLRFVRGQRDSFRPVDSFTNVLEI